MNKTRQSTKWLKKHGIVSIKTVDDAKKWMRDRGWEYVIHPYSNCAEVIISNRYYDALVPFVVIEDGHQFEGFLKCIINIIENRNEEVRG